MKTPYDEIAEEYYSSFHKTCRNFDHTTAKILQSENPFIPTTGLALEVGAGRGRLQEYLRIEADRIVQLDISEKMLTLSPRESSLLRVLHDGQSLPFLSGQFCLVAGFLCDPFWGRNFLTESHRVLAAGGKFIATLPAYSWGAELRSKIRKDTMETRFIKEIQRTEVIIPSCITPNPIIEEMLHDTGFKNFTVKDYSLPESESPISNDILIIAESRGIAATAVPILTFITAEKL